MRSSDPSVERTPPFDNDEMMAKKIATATARRPEPPRAADDEKPPRCRPRWSITSPYITANGNTISRSPAKWFLL